MNKSECAKSKFTKGPWKWEMDDDGDTIIFQKKTVGGWEGVVCNYQACDDNIERDEANAALIASAPELLEACQIMLENMGDGKARVAMEKAVSKALGVK